MSKLNLVLFYTLLKVTGVIGSDSCRIEDYPYMASVTRIKSQRAVGSRNMTFYYGYTGVMLNSQWFLMAVDFNPAKEMLKPDTSTGVNYKVSYGSIKDLPQPNGSTITQMKEFEDYDDEETYASQSINKLSLISVDSEFSVANFSKFPPRANYVNTCKNLTIVGWGGVGFDQKNTTDEDFGNEMQCLYARVVYPCKSVLYGSMFCYRLTHPRRKVTESDFGHAVLCNGFLVGITHSISTIDGAATGEANNITQYSNWIMKRTGIKLPYHLDPIMDKDELDPKPTTTEHTKDQEPNTMETMFSRQGTRKANFYLVLITLCNFILKYMI